MNKRSISAKRFQPASFNPGMLDKTRKMTCQTIERQNKMGKTMRLREYLSTGWRSAVKSAKTDPSPTKAEYNSWVKRPSHKYGS